MRAIGIVALFAVVGCGGSGSGPRTAEPIADGRAPPAPASAPSAAAGAGDAPEISRSVGKPGGVVVLWPRIVLPRGSAGPDPELTELARRVQQRLAELARRAAPSAEVDVRPEPERVCPRSGCVAASVGALLTRAGGGCAVLALVSPAGQSPARIVPWYGSAKLDAEQVPFREHAERVVHVTDYGTCAALPDGLAEREGPIEQAVKGALGS